MTILTTLLAILYIAIPVLVGLYSFWATSKKDGFDQEKAFDLVAYGVFGALVMGFAADAVINWKLTVNPASISFYPVFFGFVATCSVVALRHNWSLYRVLDNMASSCVLAAAFWLLTLFIKTQFRISYALVSVALFIANYALQKYKPSFIKSGMVFSLITGIFCTVAFIFLPRNLNLIFVALLFTLSLVVLIFRIRSIHGKFNKIIRRSTHTF